MHPTEVIGLLLAPVSPLQWSVWDWLAFWALIGWNALKMTWWALLLFGLMGLGLRWLSNKADAAERRHRAHRRHR